MEISNMVTFTAILWINNGKLCFLILYDVCQINDCFSNHVSEIIIINIMHYDFKDPRFPAKFSHTNFKRLPLWIHIIRDNLWFINFFPFISFCFTIENYHRIAICKSVFIGKTSTFPLPV